MYRIKYYVHVNDKVYRDINFIYRNAEAVIMTSVVITQQLTHTLREAYSGYLAALYA